MSWFVCLFLLGGGPPSELERFLKARAEISAADISWSAETSGSTASGFVTYRFRGSPNGDRLFENRGDEDGVTWRDGSGAPVSRLPQWFLVNEEGFWHHGETDMAVAYYPPESHAAWVLEFDVFQDARKLGLSVESQQLELLTGERTDGRWSVERRDGEKVVRVTVTEEAGGARYGWDLDPGKNWNATRIWLDSTAVFMESTIELEKFGKTWFPRRITTTRNGSVVSRTEVKSANFDESRLPNTLPTSVLQLEPGYNIVWRHERPPREDPAYGRGYSIWNGEQPVSSQQWRADVRSGKSAPSKRIQEAAVRGWMDSPYLTEEEREQKRGRARGRISDASTQIPTSGWETYVKNFIIRYDLDEEQSQRAYQILKQCQEQGQRRLESKRDEIKKLNDELFEASQALDKQRSRELEENLSAALEPLDEIFNKELKPRLETLPTREQRRKAEGPASRPAATQPIAD